MTCYHPIHAFPTGRLTDSGKHEIILDFHGSRFVRGPFGRPLYSFFELPCGKCAGCRSDRARVWSARCLAEFLSYRPSDCFFLTLTYDDCHLPLDGKVSKRDLQLFFKRLRDRHSFRYFACGEYGERTKRPHYHALVFGFPIDDKVLVKAKGRYSLYSSHVLNECWPYGFAVLGSVTEQSCSYVAGYVAKKIGDDSGFLLMSRRPGIGLDYLRAEFAKGKTSAVIPTGDGSFVRLSIPRSAKPSDFVGDLPDFGESSLWNSLIVDGYDESVSVDAVENFRDVKNALASSPARFQV